MSEDFKPLLAEARRRRDARRSRRRGLLRRRPARRSRPRRRSRPLVAAMRLRGETVGEIAGALAPCAARRSVLKHPHQVIDMCGTGGTGISAPSTSPPPSPSCWPARGLKVAKHGNRTMSRRSGSADVLTALGVNIQANLAQQRRALDEAGVCFLFAPGAPRRHAPCVADPPGTRVSHHLQHCWARFPTRPARSGRCWARSRRAGSSRWRGCWARSASERAWVVHGEGLDEMTTTGAPRSPSGATAASGSST